MTEGAARRRGWAALAAALVLASLAFVVRSIPAPLVLPAHGGVSFPANADELYHARRIVHTALHFPDLIRYDHYVNHPEGAQILWPHGFDFGVAAAVRFLASPTNAREVQRAAVWAPPVLGALTVGLVTLAGWLWLSPAAGLVAGALLVLLPGHVLHSHVGMLDHHVAAAFMATTIVAAALALLSVGTAAGRRMAALALGLAMAGGSWIWTGALFHAFLVQAVLVLWMLTRPSREDAVRAAGNVALASGVACLGLLGFVGIPVVADYGPWSPTVPSRFQPAWHGAAALTLAGAALVWRRTPLGVDGLRRLAGAVGVGALVLGVALLVLSGLWDAVRASAGWFGREGDMLVHVAESQPLLRPFGRFAPAIAATRLSWLYPVFPVVWLVLGVRALRARRVTGELLVLLWTGAWGAAALGQIRFVNSFSIGYALVLGLAFAAAREALAPAWQRAGIVPRAAGAIVGIAVLGAALQPVAYFHAAHAREAQAGRRAVTLLNGPIELGRRAGIWLARETPPTRGYEDGTGPAEYGVLSSWSLGHVLRHASHRAMVQDGFGVYSHAEVFARAADYYAAEDEARAVEILEGLAVRYVVADASGAGRGDGYGAAAMTTRLATFYGSESPRHGVRALERHRLVFHDRLGRGRGLHAAPGAGVAVAVYEVVAGARIEGRAAPGAPVVATLSLHTRFGHVHTYQARTTADATGAWTLRVPYPTDDSFSSAVGVEGVYELESEGRRASVPVPERAVRSGDVVAGPDLS